MSVLTFVEGLIPVIVQDSYSREILMMAYANEEAVRLSRKPDMHIITAGAERNSGKKVKKAGIFSAL